MNSALRVLFLAGNLEDVRLVQEVLEQASSSTDILLAWVDRLAKGLEYISTNQTDAILLDLSLPDSSGLETLERILEATPSMPVIVMTGTADEKIAMQAVQAGAQDYLVKGQIDGRVLTRVIHYAVERKHIQVQLAATLDFTKRILTSSPIGVLTYKLTGECVSANEYAAHTVGATVEQLEAQNFRDLKSWKESGLYTLAERAIATGEQTAGDVHITTTFKRDAWWTAKFVTFKSSNEELLLLTISDITERKRAEEALRESETRYRLATNATNDVIWEWNSKTHKLTWSENAQLVFGYLPEEIGPDEKWWDEHIHPDDRERIVSKMDALLAGNETIWSDEYRIQRRDGSYAFIKDRGYIEREPSGEAIRMVGAMSDITKNRQAEEALRESETRFRSLIENSTDEVSIVDINGKLMYESPTANPTLGYPHGEFLDQDIFQLIHSDDLKRVQEQFAHLAQNPNLHLRDQFRLRHQNGDWRWVEAVGTNLLSEPSVRGIVINYRDITERKEAEGKILFQSNLLGAVGSAVIATDMAGSVLYWNAGAESLFGWSSAEVLGNPVVDLTTAEQSQEEAREILEQLRKGETWNGEFLLRRKDGTTFPAFVSDSPILDSNGNLAGIIGVSSDITELKRAQEAVAASQKRFQSLVEHAPDGIALLGLDGKLRQVTPSTKQILGYNMEEARGQEPAALTHPDDLPALSGLLNDLMQNPGKSARTQYRFRHKDGSWRWLESTITNLSAEPSVEAIVFNYRDVTERKQSEEEIRSRNAELSMLYNLSRALADSERLESVLDLVSQHTVQSIHSTLTRIALIEDNELVIRAGYPIRELDYDLLVGEHKPVVALPYCQSILKGRDPVVLFSSDTSLNSEEREILLLDYVNAVCLIPLWVRDSVSHPGQALGLLMLGEARSHEREPFSDEKNRLAHSIANQAATAINRIRLREQTESHLQRLAALHAIDQAINSSLNLSMTLKILLEQVTTQLSVDAADVLLLRPELNLLEFAAGHGFRGKGISRSSLRLGEPYSGQAVLERRLINIPNLEEADPPFARTDLIGGEDFVAFFVIPLIAKGQVKGVLEIYHRSQLAPEPEWLAYLETLGGQAAIAIDNYELYEGLQRSNAELRMAYDTTIEGWSGALDLRDKETEGHTRRVTELTILMAQAMGIREAEIEYIRHGALLHDIGKMGVPDRILLKPGPLTEEEWAIMKRHPVHAYELLTPIAYLRPALDIPYCHHEKWDGSGYPRGLKGEQIPLAARIFTIIDVWDALTSDRPYRPAWTKEETLKYIQEQSGKHFDPKVVEVFLQVIPKI